MLPAYCACNYSMDICWACVCTTLQKLSMLMLDAWLCHAFQMLTGHLTARAFRALYQALSNCAFHPRVAQSRCGKQRRRQRPQCRVG